MFVLGEGELRVDLNNHPLSIADILIIGTTPKEATINQINNSVNLLLKQFQGSFRKCYKHYTRVAGSDG